MARPGRGRAWRVTVTVTELARRVLAQSRRRGHIAAVPSVCGRRKESADVPAVNQVWTAHDAKAFVLERPAQKVNAWKNGEDKSHAQNCRWWTRFRMKFRLMAGSLSSFAINRAAKRFSVVRSRKLFPKYCQSWSMTGAG